MKISPALRRTQFVCFVWTLALSALVTQAEPSRAAGGAWTELAPPCRVAHTVIYDPPRDRLILFGGSDGLLRNDVWSLPLTGTPRWTHLSPMGVPPSPREAHSAIYDPVGDRMLVFGGHDGAPRGDVWELTLAGTPQWTQLTPGGSPPAARGGHSAIYDPLRHRMLVVAGLGAGGVLGDVWQLSLGGSPTWSAIAPSGTPLPPRTRQVAIYDPPRDRLVLFGGDQGQLHQVLGDTWALALGTSPAWTLIVPSGSGPEPRSRSTAIYDPNGDRMFLQGGSQAASFFTYFDLWQLNLQTNQWTFLGDNNPLRHAAGAIYDPVRARLVLVGGSHHSIVFLSDTLVLPLAPPGAWTNIRSGGPGAITSHSAVFDPVRSRLVIFGGLVKGIIDAAPIDFVWSLDPEEGAWEFVPVGGPSPRHGHTAVFDAIRDRMLMFGGDEVYGFSPVRNDHWSLDFSPSPAWNELTPTGLPPPPRYEHTAVIDPVGDRMIVFGGSSGGLTGPPDYFNDAWQLSLSSPPGWSPLLPDGTPPAPREGHTAVYDPVGHRMVVFGGLTDTGMMNDVWDLTLDDPPKWSEISPGGIPPSPRYGHVAVYDPVGHRMLVGGGFASGGTVDEVWALSLGGSPTWTKFIPYGPSPGRPFQHAAAYDPVHERMLVSGGYGASGTWSFAPPGAVGVDPLPSTGLVLVGPRPHPTRGDLIVVFRLPDAAPAQLELFDVAGRRLESRAVGSLGAGEHRVLLAPAGKLPTGIYLLRLSRGSQHFSMRAAVVR
ncbi:MAG: Kelch repeat-containing protein [Candidatus Eiseniibacteriota bacterium]